jgi:BNR repeat-like domain
MIHSLDSVVIYENPKPHVRSRHGYFPGLAALPSAELLAFFVIGEAFESADAATHLSRSLDGGLTWKLQGPLYPSDHEGVPTSDYLKASPLDDGTLVALGYRFQRHDPEQGIGIAETGGLLPGDNIVSFSRDSGRSWLRPTVIARTHPELLEVSGPCLQTQQGDLLAVAAPLKLPDGSNPSGQCGILLRSTDGGATWSDRERFFETPDGNVTPLESRICQMEDGRLVVLSWGYDYRAERHLPNHVAVSRDNGLSWTAPIDTGVMGQASNLIAWGGDQLLTIHAHRAENHPGIYVRKVDFRAERWTTIEEACIYGSGRPVQTTEGQPIVDMFQSLRFGQPSLLRTGDDEVLATHWCVEDGQGKIRTHRIRVV